MGIRKKILSNALYVLAVTAVIFVVWAIAAAVADSEFAVPSIRGTFVELGDVLSGRLFWRSLGGTLLRCAIGFAISVALAFSLYFLCSSFVAARKIVEPIIAALRSMPAVAVTLILILAVGVYGTPIVLGVLVIMPMTYSGLRAKTATLPRELEETAALLGANKLQTMRILWMPCLAPALPEILASALSYDIKTVIGAEILAQTGKSLGMLMKLSQANLQPARLIAYVIAAVAISVAAEILLKFSLKLALAKYSE